MTQSTWLQNVSEQIFETLSLDDLGTLPPFPLEEFTKNLKERFGKEISISIEKTSLISAEDFYKDLGKKTLTSPLTFQGLDQNFYFSMGMEDCKHLLSYMEKNEEEEEEQSSPLIIEDESLIKGLYTYLLTEAIDTCMMLNIYKDLSLKITDGVLDALFAKSIDISIELKNRKILSRLLIPEAFEKKISSHFSFIPPTLENLEQIPNVQVPLSITTGSLELCQGEIKELEKGDFLIFNNSFYKPNDQKGSFQLLVGKTPLFQIKKQKDGIKVLDYLYFYNEENMDEENMDEENIDLSDDAHEDDEHNDENKNDEHNHENKNDEHNHESVEDAHNNELFDEDKENLDENLDFEEKEKEEEEEDLDDLLAKEMGHDDFSDHEDEDSDLKDKSDEPDVCHIDDNKKDKALDVCHLDQEMEKADHEFDDDVVAKPLTPEKTNLSGVPLLVQMEIARFSLSLEELKKITPGHKLPVNINPLTVNLVISGKSIGKGEIIQTGDTIGVRITELN